MDGKIKAYIDFILSNNFRKTRHGNQTSALKWSSPSEGSVMINVDAVIFSVTANGSRHSNSNPHGTSACSQKKVCGSGSGGTS